MQVTKLVEKLSLIGDDSVITLNDGTKISANEIVDVNCLPSTYSFKNILKNVIKSDTRYSVLSKFLDDILLHNNRFISPTLKYQDALNVLNNKVIRGNSKWIYRELLFRDTINLTLIELNGKVFIREDLSAINSLISFINNKRPIIDMFNVSNNGELWFDDFDAQTKDDLLNVPVKIQYISSNTTNNNHYVKVVRELFDIPQYAQ